MFYTILPQSIISIIYTYDSTYHINYKHTIHQIYSFGFKTRLKKSIYTPCIKHNDLIGTRKITYSI